MDMTLQELLDAYEFGDIEDTFARLYEKTYKRNAVGYEQVFETLKEYDDIVFSDYKIHIEHVDDGDDPYEHVNGKKESEDFFVSLSFTPWKEWLGMRISDGAIDRYTGQEILCHILWEMTFYGYNENEIQRVISEIDMSVKEYESAEALMEELEDIEEEAESRTILEKMLKNEIESSSSSMDH